MRVSLAHCVGVWGVDAESGRWGSAGAADEGVAMSARGPYLP